MIYEISSLFISFIDFCSKIPVFCFEINEKISSLDINFNDSFNLSLQLLFKFFSVFSSMKCWFNCSKDKISGDSEILCSSSKSFIREPK